RRPRADRPRRPRAPSHVIQAGSRDGRRRGGHPRARGRGGARHVKRPILTLFALVALLSPACAAHAKTLRVFVIGNSFSNNALLYLPKIVQSAGEQIVVKSASIGGAPLEKHWNGVAAYLADPDAKAGKIYGGKSLKDMLGDTRWDIVTIQQ